MIAYDVRSFSEASGLDGLILCNLGADVNRATTTNDHTVLSLACAGGYLAVVELLLAHGAKPDHILKVLKIRFPFSLVIFVPEKLMKQDL